MSCFFHKEENSLPPPAREARIQNRGEEGFPRMAAGHSWDAGKRVRASSPAPEQSRTSRNGCPAFFMRKQNSLPPPACARRACKTEVRQGSCEWPQAIRGMPGSEFEPRHPLQNKRTSERMSFCFGFRPPEAASALRYLNARGRQQSRPAQFPACGREFKRHSARGPEGPLGSISSNSPKAENIDFNRPFQLAASLCVRKKAAENEAVKRKRSKITALKIFSAAIFISLSAGGGGH